MIQLIIVLLKQTIHVTNVIKTIYYQLILALVMFKLIIVKYKLMTCVILVRKVIDYPKIILHVIN